MGLLPKSPKARRRLWLIAAITPVLALALGLSLWAMRDAVTFFYSPSEITEEVVPAGRVIRLGGLVEDGSVQTGPGAMVRFGVTDNAASTAVVFEGDLPDLFREGQGVVVLGAFDDARVFQARQVLARHDENYLPREVADRLKEKGEWRGPQDARP